MTTPIKLLLFILVLNEVPLERSAIVTTQIHVSTFCQFHLISVLQLMVRSKHLIVKVLKSSKTYHYITITLLKTRQDKVWSVDHCFSVQERGHWEYVTHISNNRR